MKGEKIYSLAKTIHQEMYATTHSAEDQITLYTRYFELIRNAAYKRHVEGQYTMGNLHEDIGYLGIPNPMYNAKRAVYWYTKACKNGHAEACNNLAHLYELGSGCEKSLETALNLYQQSAVGGSASGKKNYKLMLRDMSEVGKYNKQATS